MTVRTVEIGEQTYFRIADAHWTDPLDASHAARGTGQRWNPPGIPCLYLNGDRPTVDANLRRVIGPYPYAQFLDPATAPVVLEVELPRGVAADVYTPQGVSEVGLPSSCPLDHSGNLVPHQRCQAVGQAVLDVGLDGVDCRSAAPGGDRELAWFPLDRQATVLTKHTFDDWRDASRTAS